MPSILTLQMFCQSLRNKKIETENVPCTRNSMLAPDFFYYSATCKKIVIIANGMAKELFRLI